MSPAAEYPTKQITTKQGDVIVFGPLTPERRQVAGDALRKRGLKLSMTEVSIGTNVEVNNEMAVSVIESWKVGEAELTLPQKYERLKRFGRLCDLLLEEAAKLDGIFNDTLELEVKNS